MKSSKALYSRCFKEYELRDDDLKKLQDNLLEMFLDIKRVCDSNDIKYMVSGGTLLGAIRHGGFIPWDDDIDIMMVREEYEKFRSVFPGDMYDKYELVEPLQDKYVVCKQPKIYKKNTVYVEVDTAGIPAHNHLFIDVFIIENVPSNYLIRKAKAKAYDFSYKAASVCMDYVYPSPVIEAKAKDDKELNEYYTFRKRIGFLFAHVGGMRFYLKVCDKLARHKRHSGLMSVPSAISYEKELTSSTVFEEVTTGSFCGHDVLIPKQYDIYLRNLYGDYMQIPPEDKREHHAAYKIEL